MYLAGPFSRGKHEDVEPGPIAQFGDDHDVFANNCCQRTGTGRRGERPHHLVIGKAGAVDRAAESTVRSVTLLTAALTVTSLPPFAPVTAVSTATTRRGAARVHFTSAALNSV